MTTNTDVERLIADLERRSEVHAELAKQGKKAEPWPELLARAATALRTMQAERDAALKEVRFHVDDAVKAWNAHEAAEAKLAEVEKERDHHRMRGDTLAEGWRIADEGRIEAEATVASLQAQVEAMRGALEKIKTLDDQAECCSVGVQNGYFPPECCGQPLYGLDRARLIAHTALTTEKTNG
jgi:hypothetical protein